MEPFPPSGDQAPGTALSLDLSVVGCNPNPMEVRD
jgi:hypothetical protein